MLWYLCMTKLWCACACVKLWERYYNSQNTYFKSSNVCVVRLFRIYQRLLRISHTKYSKLFKYTKCGAWIWNVSIYTYTIRRSDQAYFSHLIYEIYHHYIVLNGRVCVCVCILSTALTDYLSFKRIYCTFRWQQEFRAFVVNVVDTNAQGK